MQTPGNFSSLLDPPLVHAAKRTTRNPVGKIGNWTIYDRKPGGMGDIYICGTDDAPGEFALKSFKSHLFFDPESRRAFLTEITVWLRLTGTPFIIPALSVEQHDGRLFVLMPAVQEDERHVSTVANLIAHKAGDAVEVFTVAWQLAVGMKLAGDTLPGVSHGDLKPSNLLYNGGPVLISDFGLAAVGNAEGRPLKTTPQYEAPEYETTGPTPATDMYSVGIILSELAQSCASPGRSLFRWRRQSGNSHLIQALKQVSKSCCMDDPKLRPSFTELVQKLGEFVLAYPDDLREMFVRTGFLHGQFREMRASMLPDIAEGLLKIDAPEHALEVLDSLDEEEHTSKVYLLKGTGLSLLDRDHEALVWFEKALSLQITGNERLHCLSEYALSLKRVGRFDEAEEIYVELLGKAKESQVGQITVNLASVYAEQGKHQEAVDLLLRFIRTHHDEPLAFASLGNSYVALGRYNQAASQYQRALALAPQLADVQVSFARLCLQYLNRWEDADAALYAAHQQGFSSFEWLLLAVVSSTLTGREGDFKALMEAAKQNLSSKELEKLEKEAVSMSVAAMRNAVGDDQSSTTAVHSAMEDEIDKQAPFSTEPVSAAPTASTPSETAQPTSDEFAPAGFPFFNTRFYFPENRYSIDYYDDIGSSGYVTRFLETYNVFQRDPQLHRNAEPRSTPFYFHCCPNCSAYILTNRDEGSNISCRQCNSSTNTRCVGTERATELLDDLHRALVRSLKNHEDLRLFLTFQLVSDDPDVLAKMKRICKEEGFESFGGPDSALGHFCKAALRRAGMPLDERREIVTVSKLSVSDELGYAGETAPETDRLLRRLRSLAPIRSVSTDLDSAGEDPASLLFGGKAEELELQCRKAVEQSPEDTAQLQLLIEILRINKKTAEAKRLSLRWTQWNPDDPRAWAALGATEKDLGEWQSAISRLTKATAIDPLSRDALVNLLLCYEKIGDTDSTQQTWSRIQALGGPAQFG